jgi:hypothetical protein
MKLKLLERFPKNDIIWEVSNPETAQKKAFELLGDDAILYRSWLKNKKYAIIDPETEKFIHFGHIDYEDFTHHKNLVRRNNYLRRTANIKGDWKTNEYSPNWLSRNIIW